MDLYDAIVTTDFKNPLEAITWTSLETPLKWIINNWLIKMLEGGILGGNKSQKKVTLLIDLYLRPATKI